MSYKIYYVVKNIYFYIIVDINMQVFVLFIAKGSSFFVIQMHRGHPSRAQ